jgi:NADH-quinone oxidoreductase subunit M
MLLKGIYDYQAITGIIAGTTLILGAVYTFKAYQASMYGPVKLSAFADLHWSELVVFAIIMIAVVFLGVYPKAVIDFVEPSVTQLVAMITNSSL